MVMFCPDCWAENRLGDKVCGRCGAVLTGRQDGDFVDKLILALGHPEPLTRRRAAWILGQRRERRALGPLVAVIRHSTDPDLLEGAVEALGRIGDERAVDPLAALLSDSYLSVRLQVVAALDRIGGPRALVVLRRATQDPSTLVRQDAARALARLGTETAEEDT